VSCESAKAEDKVKMQVLIIVPRYSAGWGEYYQIPLGLGYIASAMKRAGHTVTSLNLNHKRGTIEELVAAKVTEINPDICASGSLAPFLSILKSIFSAARQAKPGIINIAGGGMVSGEPEMSLRVMDIDIGVINEGEQTIVELLDHLEQSKDLRHVCGIVFRGCDGEIVLTPPRLPADDLGQIAWPDYELLECGKNLSNQRALDSYFLQTQPDSRPRAMDMITSRSCPFSCTFCFHPVGKVYRERPLDDFFAELDKVIARYKINMVALIDELFSLRNRRLLEFCERIKPYQLQWMIQLHVNSASEETLKALHDAGCTYISYGVESMSPKILESMRKKSKPDSIASVLSMTYKHRIGIQGNLLFGDKAETLETANESMHWWAHNRCYQINLTPLVVYPGSPDYYEALETGLITDREAYAADIQEQLNVSRMNDKNIEMLRFQVWVFANTLLNLAPLRAFKRSAEQVAERETAYDIVWDCPNCGRRNDYLGVILPPENRPSLRLTCRDCLSRWDIENKAYRLPNNEINEETCISQLKVAEALFEAGKYKECHDTANELLGLAPAFIPARLLMAMFYRRLGPPEHMLKSYGAALGVNPFDSQRHNDFADALADIGAYGAARMHYQQALALSSEDERAKAGIELIDSDQISDEQRETYFISWSDDPPPRTKRKNKIRLKVIWT
jgi:anaerobic magnesium-protoporphyrin IX monomethyl ester cyclase